MTYNLIFKTNDNSVSIVCRNSLQTSKLIDFLPSFQRS